MVSFHRIRATLYPRPIIQEFCFLQKSSPKIVEEALQMRRELEKLGVWEDSGSRVSNPFETKPTLKPREESRSRLITQNR